MKDKLRDNKIKLILLKKKLTWLRRQRNQFHKSIHTTTEQHYQLELQIIKTLDELYTEQFFLYHCGVITRQRYHYEYTTVKDLKKEFKWHQ